MVDLDRVAERAIRPDRVVAPVADSRPRDVARVGKIVDDDLGRALRDPDRRGEVAQADIRVAGDADQGMPWLVRNVQPGERRRGSRVGVLTR